MPGRHPLVSMPGKVAKLETPRTSTGLFCYVDEAASACPDLWHGLPDRSNTVACCFLPSYFTKRLDDLHLVPVEI